MTIVTKPPSLHQLKCVLVASDLSAASERALSYGVAIAQHCGAKLFLAHVLSSARGSTMNLVAGPTAQSNHLALELNKRLLTYDVHDLEYQVVIGRGDVASELESVVRNDHVDLIIVGTHNRTGFGKIVLGSVAEQIFRRVSCPVLTVGPHSSRNADISTTGRVRVFLFPTDFSLFSLSALPKAVSFANQAEARLALLHVLCPIPRLEPDRWYTSSDIEEMRKERQVSVRGRLERLTSNFDLLFHPMCLAEIGNPVGRTLCVTKELGANAIIMGLGQTRHPRSVSHLPWSTAYNIVCGASCPVMTMKYSSAGELASSVLPTVIDVLEWNEITTPGSNAEL